MDCYITFCSEAKATCCGRTACTAPSVTRGPVPASADLEKQMLGKNMAPGERDLTALEQGKKKLDDIKT